MPTQSDMSVIPYGRQTVSPEDIQAVVSVLQSDWLTQGPAVPAFEEALGKYCGARHAVAVNSATSALHLACLALDLGPGDSLWTSPITFVASANCALYCGADVDFVDIDPYTYNLDPKALEEKLEWAEGEGRLPKVVVPVHMCGLSCDMEKIHELSTRYGFRIIEDASHALGGKYQGKPVGNCQYSDITVFSFHPVKIITTGEGGVAMTNDAEIAARMARLRSHGITRDTNLMTKVPDGVWYYQQIELGYNYRMSDIQAALGYSQLSRLDEKVAVRNKLADDYHVSLASLPIKLPAVNQLIYSSYHLYVIRVDGGRRDKLFSTLSTKGIGVNVHYIPVHTQPYYQKRFGFSNGDYPQAERYYAEAITLPLFPGLTRAEQVFVCRSIAEVME